MNASKRVLEGSPTLLKSIHALKYIMSYFGYFEDFKILESASSSSLLDQDQNQNLKKG